MSLKSLKKLHASHGDRLLNMINVVGTAIGNKWVDGKPTNNPAIVVFVETKESESDIISKSSLHNIIPKRVGNTPTDVIEVGKIVKHGFQNRVRPIKPGYSCGHYDVTCGTIGGIFTDKDGDSVILTNNHVAANEGKANIGDVIYQPGRYDNSSAAAFSGWNDPVANLPYFATLKRFIPINATGNKQDSAIAAIHEKLSKGGLVDANYPVINRPLAGFGSAKLGQRLQKFGRTTGHTTGTVIGINASFGVGYDFGAARFDNCIVTSSMSQGGDSGSIIMDMNMNAIALLFAGSSKVTIGTPIDVIRETYGLNLYSQPVPSTTEWKIINSSDTTLTTDGGTITITSPNNKYCFTEIAKKSFTSTSCTVNSGSDVGATWGPGLVVQWPTGMVKVNLRYNGTFGGYYNGDENINVGRVKPNTDYELRIRRSTKTIIGEIQDAGKWYVLVEVPNSVFPSSSVIIRVGKTGARGNAVDHSDQGLTGTCYIKNIKT